MYVLCVHKFENQIGIKSSMLTETQISRQLKINIYLTKLAFTKILDFSKV